MIFIECKIFMRARAGRDRDLYRSRIIYNSTHLRASDTYCAASVGSKGRMASLKVGSARDGSFRDVSPCFSNRSDIYRREMQVVSQWGSSILLAVAQL